jgi:hypothetical protein
VANEQKSPRIQPASPRVSSPPIPSPRIGSPRIGSPSIGSPRVGSPPIENPPTASRMSLDKSDAQIEPGPSVVRPKELAAASSIEDEIREAVGDTVEEPIGENGT